MGTSAWPSSPLLTPPAACRAPSVPGAHSLGLGSVSLVYSDGMMNATLYSQVPDSSAVTGAVIATLAEAGAPPPPTISSVTGEVMATLLLLPWAASAATFLPKMKPVGRGRRRQ